MIVVQVTLAPGDHTRAYVDAFYDGVQGWSSLVTVAELLDASRVDAIFEDVIAASTRPVNDPLRVLKAQAKLHGIEVRYTGPVNAATYTLTGWIVAGLWTGLSAVWIAVLCIPDRFWSWAWRKITRHPVGGKETIR